MTPPQVRGLVPRSPLGSSVLFSGTVLELTCDAYTKSEADGRYVQSGNLGSLDSRYFPVNGNNGGGGIFPMVITTLTPRMIRAILPRAPLSGALILGNAGTLELNCDCYSTSESDLRYYTKGQSDAAYAPLAVQAEQQANTSAIGALDSRVTALEGSGGVPADISCTSLTASSFVNTLNFTATGNTTGVDALFTQDVQTPLLRPVSAVDNHLRIAAGLVSTRLVDNDGVTVLAQFSGLEAHMQVPTRCDRRLTIDDVSGPAEGLFTNEISARTGDNLLTINGGVNGVTVLGPGLAVAGTMRATTQVTTPSVVAETGFAHLTLASGSAGTRIIDGASNALLVVESDETQCLSRVLSVSHSAAGGVAGAVLKNTASTGVARLQLDANTATGFAQLEVAPTGNCTLNAPGQEIWLQNRLTGQAPLIVETSGIVTTAYGQNDLSDEKVKQNIRDADLEELQAIFDRAKPKRYDRADVDQKDRLGFLAQDLQHGGRRGAAHTGLRQADRGFVGSLQAAAGESRGARGEA